jgi:hypothetical protein
MTEPIYCSRCDCELEGDEIHFFDEEYLCLTCLEEDTVICDHCGDRIWIDDNFGNDNRPLCQNCRENHYYECFQCGRIIHSDYAHYDENRDHDYCEECYEDSDGGIIHNYSYKPDPVFHGEGSRYFGVELEIDHGGENEDNAYDIMEIANALDQNLYCKHDGSIDNGFEMVTHPMTLDYHRNAMPWEKVVAEAVGRGYRSHQTDTCGLHIHVNRNCFGESVEQQDSAIARVLYFVENHWVELLRFSRRTKSQLANWAARYGRRDSPKEILNSAKDSYARYRCVNLTNWATIEFRIFRGTLKYNTIIATLQLVNEICDVATRFSDEDLDELSWTDFVERLPADDVPELITYLKEKRLYINEPVMIGAEL